MKDPFNIFVSNNNSTSGQGNTFSIFDSNSIQNKNGPNFQPFTNSLNIFNKKKPTNKNDFLSKSFSFQNLSLRENNPLYHESSNPFAQFNIRNNLSSSDDNSNLFVENNEENLFDKINYKFKNIINSQIKENSNPFLNNNPLNLEKNWKKNENPFIIKNRENNIFNPMELSIPSLFKNKSKERKSMFPTKTNYFSSNQNNIKNHFSNNLGSNNNSDKENMNNPFIDTSKLSHSFSNTLFNNNNNCISFKQEIENTSNPSEIGESYNYKNNMIYIKEYSNNNKKKFTIYKFEANCPNELNDLENVIFHHIESKFNKNENNNYQEKGNILLNCNIPEPVKANFPVKINNNNDISILKMKICQKLSKINNIYSSLEPNSFCLMKDYKFMKMEIVLIFLIIMMMFILFLKIF